MTHADFIVQIDEAAVVAAIRGVESRTSGEIRVLVSHREVSDPMSEAQQRFTKLGMTNSAQRNGVLIFIAPNSRCFAILGDTGLHERCGDLLWQAASRALTTAFRTGEWTAGLVNAIALIGDELARHFPFDPAADRNELPDEVATDHPPSAG